MAAAYSDQDERLACLDAALKDCIHQISSLQEEQELELKEANNKFVRSLLCKQELVEELERDKLHLEAQLDALIDKVDYVEKENAFLKCECCALERDLLLRPQNHFMEDSGKQIVPVLEAYTDEITMLKHGHWPWNVLDMILEEHRVSKRSINQLLEEIKSSLAPSETSGLNLNESICRMIELIEEISLKEENKWLNHNLRSLKATNDRLRTRLEEAKVSIGRLREEVEGLEESKRIVEDQFENQKVMNEDLDTQLTVTTAKQKEMARKISSLEVELEDKNQSCEELETTCLELQLQLQILSRKGTPDGAEARYGSDKQTVTEGTKLAEFQQHLDKEKPKQHHSLLDILRLTDDNDTKTEASCPDTTAARVITVVSSQTPGGGFGFAKKLFMNLQRNASTLKRSKRSYSSGAVDEFDV